MIVILCVGAILLCTVHLCLGIWIGRTAQHKSEDELDFRWLVEGAATQMRSQLAEFTAVRAQAIEFSLACAVSEPPLPLEIVSASKNLARACTSLQAGCQALARKFQYLEQASKSQAGDSLSDRLPRASSQGSASPTRAIQSTETSLKTDRFPYDGWQHIAPLDGAYPRAGAFLKVRSRDLSSDGFSFFSEELPTCDSLVAALGRPPKLLFMECRITSSNVASLDGKVGHSIRCRFIRKLPDLYRWDEAKGIVMQDGVAAAEV